jgi:hypothetical protein
VGSHEPKLGIVILSEDEQREDESKDLRLPLFLPFAEMLGSVDTGSNSHLNSAEMQFPRKEIGKR